MKRKFMTAALISLSLAMSTSFVGCKDYDDDITEINANTTGLSNQISDLKAELQQQAANLAAAAQAAQDAADQAMTAAQLAIQKGDAAMAEAQLAHSAAEQAKAEALAKLAEEAETRAAELSSLKASMEALIQANTTAIQNNATAIGNNANLIAENAAAIQDLQEQMTKVVSDYAELQGRVSAIDEKLANEVETLNATIAKLEVELVDKIKELEATLQAQINGLSGQVEQNKTNIAANEAAIATLQTQFNTLSKEVAALAKAQQATQTQLDALQTFTENLEKEFKDFQGQTNAAIGGIQSDITDLNAYIEELKGRADELEAQAEEAATKLQDILDTRLPAIQEEIGKMQDNITDLQSEVLGIHGDISGLQGSVGELTDDLESVKGNLADVLKELRENVSRIDGELATVNTELERLNTEILKINGALSTLNSTLSRRLSSVTFVPLAYVDGIPAIDFSSIEYVPMVKSANGNWEKGSGDVVHVASTDIKAVYRLNPNTVTLEDIVVDGLEFVDGVATSRAATESSLIKVADNGATINENGELVLNVVKNSAALFNEGLAKNQINIVALKVPVASQHLLEGEDQFCVYSEYVRLSEFQLTPQVGKVTVENADPQFADSLTAYTDVPFDTIRVPFNTDQDLLEIVDAVLINKGDWYMSLDTPEERATYGLDLKFHMATEEYLVDGVDQQIFGKVAGNVFSPVMPAGYSTQSLIGKTPIVVATLVDTKNNYVVDQRYVKLVLSAPKLDAKPEFDFTTPIFCGDTIWNVSWTELVDAVGEFCPEELGKLTKEEFIKYYVEEGTMEPVAYANYAPDAEKTGVAPTFVATDTNALTWTVDADQVGVVKGTKTVTVVITLTNADRGTITITLNLTVTLGDAQMPTLGKTDQLYWNNETMLIYPTNPALGGLAEYNTNILIGRYGDYDDTLSYVNNLLDCASYYMFLQDVDTASAYLKFPTEFATPFSVTAANQKGLANPGVFFYIENDNVGIQMVQDTVTVTMNWDAYLNGETAGNLLTFGVSKLKIVPPLYLTTFPNAEPIKDNVNDQPRKIGKFYAVSDYYKNHVIGWDAQLNAVFENETLYDFYGIEGVIYGPDEEIMIADDIQGLNWRSPREIQMSIYVDPDGTLHYRNDGAVLDNNAYIFVPVTIKHRWGVLKSDPDKKTNYIIVELQENKRQMEQMRKR